ncbi:MAG: hypothetical protein Q8922_01420 [Bacteroidota bacterium]|nr:hypothetical protein [Bacteroidota bacterium]MDP4232113.1 hypothetical protein [Bacteroidota bacterium]MDP4241179.1 hypothetical protein [Bacteroidota bacterium]MDP4286571.1 hypothetical protein [Bacteroidota bacterium]
MKDIIRTAVRESRSRTPKPAKKKIYTLRGPKQAVAASALKVLGALNALNKVLGSITGHARKVVFKNLLPEWLTDVVKGGREANAFTVTTDDAKALIVPMKKYAIIDEARAEKIMELKDKFGVEIDIEEIKHFEFNPQLVHDIPEDKMDALVDELKKVLLKSEAIPANVKKDIRSGRTPVIEEHTEYRYGEDILTNLTKLSKGDPKKAEAIIEAVQPVMSVRSFEMEDREVQVGEALDLIKESLAESDVE